MTITQELVAESILARLHSNLSERKLVHCAEAALVARLESEQDVPQEDGLIKVLACLGAGDRPACRLSRPG